MESVPLSSAYNPMHKLAMPRVRILTLYHQCTKAHGEVEISCLNAVWVHQIVSGKKCVFLHLEPPVRNVLALRQPGEHARKKGPRRGPNLEPIRHFSAKKTQICPEFLGILADPPFQVAHLLSGVLGRSGIQRQSRFWSRGTA